MTAKRLSTDEIRKRFLAFFEKRGHRVVPSAPLIPRSDPTLLFTNAGMNPFKGVFTGQEKREYKRAVSVQKCVRAGGKHNDLENVGRTARHHTFFEMLGNFSFGDYFKKEAVAYAWEFVTKELKLPEEKLHVSVYREDGDAFRIWRDGIGLAEERIRRFGEKDNFWSMGETGPCGPCSEIYFDRGREAGCGGPDCKAGCGCDRYVEIWNLVFMEFEARADGTRANLPEPSIDTGMGLERVAAVVQGAAGNYGIDLFAPILERIGAMSGKEYPKASEAERVSMRVVADHIRAITFLIADGALPANEGRGYVLRRIMRRAMRHGRKIGLTEPFMGELSRVVTDVMGGFYPELATSHERSAGIIRREEERFAETIDRGLEILHEEIGRLRQANARLLPGDVAFRLYDTYGFPLDLTADVLREQNLGVDRAAFEEAFSAHREKARGSWRGSAQRTIDGLARRWAAEGLRTEFVGYDSLSANGTIRRLVKEGAEVPFAAAGDEVELVADRTPFYAESGGQVGDIGGISGEGFALKVIDTRKTSPEIHLHRCLVTDGEVAAGSEALFQVDGAARAATAKNHTATHILHATLKELLGPHVKQEGSLVAPERLRFDFSHPAALDPDETAAIERKVNERIWLDPPVLKEVMPLDAALESGAAALFDEKYGEDVRVVAVGDYSRELCGGTHLKRAGEIGLFKIVKESSVSAGVRRIEAYTGHRALAYVGETDRKLKHAGAALGVPAEELAGRIDKLLARQKELEKEVRRLKAGAGAAQEREKIAEIGGVRVLTAEADVSDHRELRELADRHMEKLARGVVVIGARGDGKAFVVVKVSKDLAGRHPATRLIEAAAKALGGSGGGRPDMAQAGGPRVEKLAEAVEAVLASVSRPKASWP